MKKVLWIALFALVIAGCGGKGSETADLKAQVDDLGHRVKFLEDDLLKADKQLIQQQQTMEQLREQMRTMETYMEKIQYAQSTTTR